MVEIRVEPPELALPIPVPTLQRASEFLAQEMGLAGDFVIRIRSRRFHLEPLGLTKADHKIDVFVDEATSLALLLRVIAHEMGHHIVEVHPGLVAFNLGRLSRWGERVNSSLWAISKEDLAQPLARELAQDTAIQPVVDDNAPRRQNAIESAAPILCDLEPTDFRLMSTHGPEPQARLVQSLWDFQEKPYPPSGLSADAREFLQRDGAVKLTLNRLAAVMQDTCRYGATQPPSVGDSAYLYSRDYSVIVAPSGKARPVEEMVRVLISKQRTLICVRVWHQSLLRQGTCPESSSIGAQVRRGQKVRLEWPADAFIGPRTFFGVVTSTSQLYAFVLFEHARRTVPVPFAWIT